MPFYVVAGGATVAGLYGLWRIPETNHPRDREARGQVRAEPWTWLRFALSPNFLAVGLVTFAIFSARLGARGTLLPLLGTSKFGLSPGALGGVLTLTALGGLVVIGPAAFVADRFGRKATIVPSGIVSAGGIVLMAVAPSSLWLVVGAIVTTFGTGFAGPAPAAYVGDIAPPELRGLSMGLFRSAGDVGFVVAPPLLGGLADATSIGWAMIANAGLMAVASVFFGIVAAETVGSRRKVIEIPAAEVAETVQP
jgi:MFS family permease